jgi:hypothetical protein
MKVRNKGGFRPGHFAYASHVRLAPQTTRMYLVTTAILLQNNEARA